MPDRLIRLNATGLNRRAFLRILSTCAGAGLLTACAPSSPASAPAPTAAKPPAAGGAPPVSQATPAVQGTAQPKIGGSLRVGLQADLPSLNPFRHTPYGYDTLWQAFDRLIAYDGSLTPQPMLAESWEISPDFKQIKFNLRKGVQWHSGREFTSEDVKWSLLWIRDPEVGSSEASQSNWWTSIETPDKYTVVLKSEQARPLVFDLFELVNIGDRESLEGQGARPTKVVGTGPFVLSEWLQGDHIKLVKNKNYWNTGRPYLDEINFQILPDAQAMATQFEAGTLDIVFNPTWQDFGRLKANSRYQTVINEVSGQWYSITINTNNKPLDDKRVRQALNYAMDRQRFVQTFLYGTSPPKSLYWTPSSPGFEASKENYFAFNLDMAKALLSEAGASTFETEVLISNDLPEIAEFAQLYQADLAKLGVKLNIRKQDSAAFTTEIAGKNFPGMYAYLSGKAHLEPPGVLTTPSLIPVGNRANFTSDRYTQLVNAAGTEIDLQKRKQLYSQINDLLLDEAFATPLASTNPRMITSGKVHGFATTMHIGFDWTQVWVG
jgi:peptide/nickel transport system substrate-binding protein